MLHNEQESAARFLDKALRQYASPGAEPVRVLDFGCGGGELVECLASRGYDAHGCDIKPFWAGAPKAPFDRLRVIESHPYRIPFEDRSFDAVVSTSVLEHAQNKEELFPEIHRVLKPGGVSMHLYPSKWYLPTEPHIYVPLVSYVWPRCPRWWLALWAMAGVRNEFQQGLPWRQVTDLNATYCDTGLSYWSHGRFARLLGGLFAEHRDETAFFVREGYGGLVALTHRMRLPVALGGWLSRTFRMAFVVSRKAATGSR